MRVPGSRSGYNHLPNDEGTERTVGDIDPLIEANDSFDLEAADGLPLNPPSYENAEGVEPLELEDINTNVRLSDKVHHYIDCINTKIIEPVRYNIMDPLAQILTIISEKGDLYLSKIGNPMILRRFFYIFFMSFVAWVVLSSGFMPGQGATRSRGMFSDHNILVQYARKSLDLSKLERDLEYISSMPHMSGTKGDSAIRHYIEQSYVNNGLKLVKELKFLSYTNYPGKTYLEAVVGDQEQPITIELSPENFNPMSSNGEIRNINLIYGNMGTDLEFRMMEEKNLFKEDFAILLKYGELPSEQLLLAEKYNAKAVLFISERGDDGDGDLVQSRGMSLPQFGTGDVLTPGWYSSIISGIDVSDSKQIAHFPTIPLSFNQATKLLELLSKDGVGYGNDLYSGIKSDIKINLGIQTSIRERQPVFDIVGKIEGKEQDDKAIIICASRNAVSYGASYPNFGTTLLLSVLQLFQEMKYKYDWKPLRNIYFISFGGTEFNNAGATELMEERLGAMKDEIYSLIDITQLGVWNKDRKIEIQTHPLLHDFFNGDDYKMGFDITVEHVQQYGDWIPYMAYGIPVTVMSSKTIKDRRLPVGTSKDTFEHIATQIRDPEHGAIATDLLLYIFQNVLKIADDPLIPFNIEDYVSILEESLKELQEESNNQLDLGNIGAGLNKWKRIGMEWSGWKKEWDHLVMLQEEGIEPSLTSFHRWTWNKKLANIGKRQISAVGIPNRNFYKNTLLSPTLWTVGKKNGHWIFPSIRDALHDNNIAGAKEELQAISDIIKHSAEVFIDETSGGDN